MRLFLKKAVIQISSEIPSVENLSSALRLHAEKKPDKTYLICNEEKYTYSQVNMLVDKTCSYLKNKGLSKGEVISLIIKNSVEYVLIYLAGLRMGCPVNPYPYNLDSTDISKYLVNINPAISGIYFGT